MASLESDSKWNTSFTPESKNRETENFEVVQIEQKIKAIQKEKRLRNKKGVPPFSTLNDTSDTISHEYKPSVERGLEQFTTIKEGFGTRVQESSGQTAADYLNNYKKDLQSKTANLNSSASNSGLAQQLSVKSITEDINNALDQIGKITNGQFAEYSNGVNYGDANGLDGVFQTSVFDNEVGKRIANSMRVAITNLTTILKLVFFQISAYLRLFFKTIQLFLLNFNTYVQQSAVGIACALTGNLPDFYTKDGKDELSIFKKQIQNFLTMLMIWIFLYNWFFVMFFLEPEERYITKYLQVDSSLIFNRNAGEYKKEMNAAKQRNDPVWAIKFIPTDYTLLYGLIGPSIRVTEQVDRFITGFIGTGIQNWKYNSSNPRVNGKQIIPQYVLFFLMAFITIILVSANVPEAIMQDFFNSFSFSTVGTSLVSVFSFIIVFSYGVVYGVKTCVSMFGGLAMMGGVYTAAFALLLSLIYLVFYGYYLFSFCVPLGVIILTTYFFIYTFLALVLYHGVNIGPAIRGISKSVFKMTDILDAEEIDTCKDPNALRWTFRTTIFSLNWWMGRPYAVVRWIYKMMLYSFAFLFEIIMILMLLGGIAVYRQNYPTVHFQKASTLSSRGIGNAIANDVGNFTRGIGKQLFTWLIAINVILIILFIISMRWKYRSITGLIDSFNDALNNGKGPRSFTKNNPLAPDSEEVDMENEDDNTDATTSAKLAKETIAKKPEGSKEDSTAASKEPAKKPTIKEELAGVKESLQKSFNNFYERVRGQPDATTGEPDAMTGEPDAMTGEPDAMTNKPEATTNKPEATTNKPEATTNAGGKPEKTKHAIEKGLLITDEDPQSE